MELPEESTCAVPQGVMRNLVATTAGQTYARTGIEVAVSAMHATAESWLESFLSRVQREVLGPLQTQLTAVLSQVDTGIPVGREYRVLQGVRQQAEALCGEAFAKLEALLDSTPEDPVANDPSDPRLQRLPGLTAQLGEALKASVRHSDALASSVADFLKKSLHPATAPDLQVSYNMAQQPCTVDIILPAARITNAVLFMVGESVGSFAEEVQELVLAVCGECLAARAQEVEARELEQVRRRRQLRRRLWPSGRQRLRRTLVAEHLAPEEAPVAEEEEEARAVAIEHLAAPVQEAEAGQRKRRRLQQGPGDVDDGGPDQTRVAAVPQQVAELLAQEEEVAAAAEAVAELNPAESTRSYSSVYAAPVDDDAGEGDQTCLRRRDHSCLDAPACWCPGLGRSVRSGAEWVQLDLGRARRVCGVVTQGFGGGWVAQYDVHVGVDGATFQRVVGGPFQGNVNGGERATARFPAVVEARYVRISPTSWPFDPQLRCGVLVEA